MNTRRLSVLCLVIVVGLAGCSGLSPFGGDQTETDGQDTTDTPDLSYPDGYAESGITDPEEAVSQHQSILGESDSLTLNMNITSDISVLNMSINFRAKQNVTNERQLVSMSGGMENKMFMDESEYHSEGMIYEMNKTEDEPVQYEAYPESFDSQISLNEGLISMWLPNASFGEATQVTHDGEPMFRYETTDADSAEAFVFGESDLDATVDEFNGTLLVDEEGIVRSFTYTMTYTTAEEDQKTETLDYRLTDLDSTTVEEPDWVETARQQAD